MIFMIKASRPGFWLTSIWFYLLPLGTSWRPDTIAFWLGLIYVAMPLGMLIYAANDVTDVETDSINPRKDSFLFGARPTREQIAGLPLRIALVQVPFVLLFYWLLGPPALLWFLAVLATTTFYNAVAKNRPGLDTLAQAGYLMVFVLANWLNEVTSAAWQFWVFGALFAMHSHLFGEIMDLEPDRAAGRRTTAVVIGARATKLVIVALLLAESFLALGIGHKPWLAPFLLVGAIVFALDWLFFWRERPYPALLMKLFFIGWNLFLLFEIIASSLYSRRII
jgi:4-hydroxybenzoate polyprenyltransferase